MLKLLELALPVLISLLVALSLTAAEPDAVLLNQQLRARHLPYGMILDPIFATPESDEIVNYTRCGDSAIWTGHYLAAQSFRYAVTQDSEALAEILALLEGIRALVQVTGPGLLARCTFPETSPYAKMITDEERSHGYSIGAVNGEGWIWIGNTSRDQYAGIIFGLNAAWELVPDPEVQSRAAALVTEMLEFLLDNNWFVNMPDGRTSTVFIGRPDQQLSLLRVGSRVNPERFEQAYRAAADSSSFLVSLPIAIEVRELHDSYFKFNLDYIHFWNLLGPGNDEESIRVNYKRAYDTLRRATAGHGNAHFNMIDRAINGPDDMRDAETRQMLEDWLTRPRRDFRVDLSSELAACGANRACQPIPVAKRVTTDFLWQRSPFQLTGGGAGFVESSGIDYLLPYWMGRYYGVLND